MLLRRVLRRVLPLLRVRVATVLLISLAIAVGRRGICVGAATRRHAAVCWCRAGLRLRVLWRVAPASILLRRVAALRVRRRWL